MYSCYSRCSILECYNLFSEVELSIRLLHFILLSWMAFCRSFECFVRFVNFASLILLIIVGVELLLCTVVIVIALSWNAITFFLMSS